LKLLKLEVDAYRGEVALFEGVVGESSEERGLANGTVTDEDGLELELLSHVVSFVECLILNNGRICINFIKQTSGLNSGVGLEDSVWAFYELSYFQRGK
jgi:hypothetical protein